MVVKTIMGVLVGGLALAGASAAAADALVMRISTENSDSHFQTRVVAGFAEALTRQARGRLDVRYSPGARLFKDRDAIRALQTDQLEMAVPGTWQIDGAVPDVGLFLLPLFYGRDVAAIHAVVDGAPGREVAGRIERRLRATVLGRWIDLGFTHVFVHGTPIKEYRDMKGRRIRVAGGRANIARLETLGARAFVIPWPDFPEALALGTVDGTLTSFETVASARLWERGIDAVFADRQYFAQYVPLVAQRFWDGLPEDLRALVAATWDEQVDAGRRLAAEAQAAARSAFVAHGGTVYEPSAAARDQARTALLDRQPDLLAALGIDPALVDLTSRALGAAR
jgi:C4-dicarboxylate-binding protein DctP